MNANEYATAAHDAMVRVRAAAWAMRKACKHDNPEAWRDLCDAIAEATDAAGKAMDLTAERAEVELEDIEDRKEKLREIQWTDIR